MLDKTDRHDTGQTEPCIGELPEFYRATHWTVEAIVAATHDLNAAVKELVEVHSSRRAIPVKITAEGIERLGNQIHVLGGVMKRKAVEHVNRRSGHE